MQRIVTKLSASLSRRPTEAARSLDTLVRGGHVEPKAHHLLTNAVPSGGDIEGCISTGDVHGGILGEQEAAANH